MNPMTFQFIERQPREKTPDFDLEYDDKLNLTVDKTTKLPAIASLSLDTGTRTKVGGEESDSDAEVRMDTATRTHAQLESTDSDYNFNVLLT